MQGDVTTTNVGTHKFLAPERLVSSRGQEGFRIQSDVWSLGVSVYNIVTKGALPFPENSTIFDYHRYIVENADVELPESVECSAEMRAFVSACMRVEESERPDYPTLLAMAFLTHVDIPSQKPEFAELVKDTLDSYNRSSTESTSKHYGI